MVNLANVFVTGDTHGNFQRIARFCEHNHTSKSDHMIILGDAGINYYGGKKDAKLKEALCELPITLFCIHGNHEMRPWSIPSYQIQSAIGENFLGTFFAEQAYPNLHFAIDGQLYEFNGRKCLVIGGAYSVDKHFRIKSGMQWFPDEQPNEAIKGQVENRLKAMGWNADIIMSHTCPAKYIPTEMFLSSVDQSTVDNSTERWLDRIEDMTTYNRWLCGHYHTDKTVDKVTFMYDDILPLEDL